MRRRGANTPNAPSTSAAASPPPSSARSGLDEVALVGHDDELHAVAGAELHQDPGDVGLGGERAEVRGLGGRWGGRPGVDELEALVLAWSQFTQAFDRWVGGSVGS